ncbi:MAG TPA: formate/nitrite transporter family protein [Candidatus Acidoferrum sp.]|nr:formate/nitrite transporter family protein [Candidatus Acidoferrum sp.]
MATAPKLQKPDDEHVPSAVSSPAEKKQVEERVAISAGVVYEAICREGEDELKRPTSALAWSGLAAGLAMGFSLVAEGLLAAHLPQADWSPLISKLGYSVGFLMAILGRQQLYTENTLTVILPLLLHKNAATLASVAKLWGAVLASNLVGTYLFALCLAKIAVFSPHVQQTLLSVSSEGSGAAFGVTLTRAIFAGWLIALMVWLMPGAESSRVGIIILVTYLIGLGGFNHIIAGSNKNFFLVVSGAESWSYFLLRFFTPTLLGNIIGGVSLVAFLNHAQVVAGKEEGSKASQSPLAKRGAAKDAKRRAG